MIKQDQQPQMKISKSDLVRRAFEFAKKAHGKTRRERGEEFFSHPLEVANILANMNLDDQAIAAALLHDTVEDTGITFEDIRKNFGKSVEKLVKGVTKLEKLSFEGSTEEYSIENLRRIFLAMSDDIRVVLIKLADRLHNMRTLDSLPRERQLAKARETLEIYAPVAERLCMGEFKGTLEDLAFPYVYPEEYKWIKNHLTKKYEERRRLTEKVQKRIRKELHKKNINVLNTHGRAKHLYSLYRKLLRNNMDTSKIYDLVAIRTVVENVEDCYTALGIIHRKWKPMSGRIKDYIATPKPNGYQSLHTTIVSEEENDFIEVQIRTPQMHTEAEFGIAAHWIYRAKNDQETKPKKVLQWFSKITLNPTRKSTFKGLPWIKQIVELEKSAKQPSEFLKFIKDDVLSDRIIALTPRGDIKNLPRNSTVIDFAYIVHTDIGNTCLAAKINNKIVNLDSKIENGDVVQIITSKRSKGPKREWLNFVKTNTAKNRIIKWFSKTDLKENLKYGKKIFNDKLKEYKHLTAKDLSVSDIQRLYTKIGHKSLTDLYAAIGKGNITAHQAIDVMFPPNVITPRELLEVTPGIEKKIIMNDSQYAIKIAKCCNPTIGDAITGKIGKTTIYIHKQGCLKIRYKDDLKKIKAQWAKETKQLIQVDLHLEVFGRVGLLKDIATVLAQHQVFILYLDAKHIGGGDRLLSTMTVELKDADKIPDILRSLRKIKGIIKALKKQI